MHVQNRFMRASRKLILVCVHQEAGRAGRDGKPSNCILFADLSKLPSLLPSKYTSAEQNGHRLDSLKALFLYALRCNKCRVLQVLDYFGERWASGQRCGTCG